MCKELMLIIEVDGITHHNESQWQLDQNRQAALERVGFSILRFSDKEILSDLSNLERVIEGWVLDHPPVEDPDGLSIGALPSKGDL